MANLPPVNRPVTAAAVNRPAFARNGGVQPTFTDRQLAFLLSQRPRYNPGWYGAYYPGFAPFGWGPFGFSPFGYSPGFGWVPFGYGWGGGYGGGFGGGFGGGYGGGFGVGFGYRSGPWSFGVGLGWPTFGYSPICDYQVYSPPTVIIEQPAPVIIQPAPAPVIIPPAQPVLPEPQPQPAVQKPQFEELDFGVRAEGLLKEGKYPEAVKALRHAVVDDPKNGGLLALTGQALFATGSYDEAAGAIQQSLVATPEADWMKAASVTAKYGTTPDAVANFKKAIEKGPNQPELRFLAGYQAFAVGDYKRTVTELDALLKIAPEDRVAKQLRAAAVKLDEKK